MQVHSIRADGSMRSDAERQTNSLQVVPAFVAGQSRSRPDTNHHVSEQSRQGRRHDLGGVGVFEAATEREVLAGPLANQRQSGTEGA